MSQLAESSIKRSTIGLSRVRSFAYRWTTHPRRNLKRFYKD